MLNFILFTLLLPIGSFAQHYFYNDRLYEPKVLLEAGIGIGAINSLTDVGGKPGPGKSFIKDLVIRHTKPSFTAFFSATWDYSWKAKVCYTTGTIQGADSILQNDNSAGKQRFLRNLHFKSRIHEVAISTEWFFLSERQKAIDVIPLIAPSLILGIGIYHFNPIAKLNGRWVELAPLHTEGQSFTPYPNRIPYRLTQATLVAGGGLLYEASAFLNIGIEFLYRFLFTDYLDDISTNYINPQLFETNFDPARAKLAKQLADRRQELVPGLLTVENQRRGNNSKNDTYFNLQLKFGIILNRNRRTF
ncbi:MAG: hypothetical protein H7Y31_15555 [Chitinophagaceae bacterium]|nr:hypothetical protein [Chitinophagaceae bacterium]